MAFLVVGAVAGFLSGLLGIGGGVVMVPSLLFLLPEMGFPVSHYVHIAFATSITSAFFLTFSSALAHLRLGHAQRSSIVPLAAGGIVGAGLGSYLSSMLGGRILEKLFALFLVFSAIRLFLTPEGDGRFKGKVLLYLLVGLIAGCVAAFFGVGGGVVAVPSLIFLGFSPVEAVGTSAVLLPFITLSASLGYILTGRCVSGLPHLCLGYVYLPAVVMLVVSGIVTAQLGARVAGNIPRQTLRRIFACLLVVVAVKILLK